jgi:hypothetical protein
MLSKLATVKFGFASRAICIAHCSKAHPFVSTANYVGPTVGPIASFTINKAQLHATLTMAIPMSIDRWSCT